ncbi:MAG: DUF4968 domain-containing protein, partial [Clostridia bacterium]|nr:DUF4968 domain-containing protein [Clostridia bacterium]
MLQAPHRPTRQIEPDAIRQDAAGIELKSEYGLLRLDAAPKGIIRVRFTRKDSFTAEESPFLVNRRAEESLSCAAQGDGLIISSKRLTVAVSLKDGSVSVQRKNGECVPSQPMRLEAYKAQRIEPGAKAVTEEIETADGKKTVVRDAPRSDYKQLYRAYLPLSFTADEAVYGFGQPEFGPLNLRGRRLYLVQTNRSIASPFFVTTGGWGILVDCGCPLIYDDTKEESFLRLMGVEELDYYIIPGSCEEIVQGYHCLTGKPALLPAWAFGYIQSQERYESQDEILDLVRDYRKRGIGIDCAVEDWMSWPDGMWGQKSFDEKRFYDPKAMTDALHALNTRFMISIWANPNPKTRDSQELKEKGLMLAGDAIYNALDPRARAMYWRQAREGLYRYGVDAWWCDSSEPWTSEWGHKERPDEAETFFETGATAADALGMDRANSFAFYHAQTMYEGQRSEDDGKRVVNLTRSAWTGQQRYGTILWSGDITASWKTLKTQIAIGLNMCASGFPYWTQDIGGFFVKKGDAWYWDGDFENGWDDPEFRELYVRWYQYAAFLPVFRGHGTDVRRELTNLRGEEYEAALKYNRLRYRLLPYIYSMAGKTALCGGTLMKPLGFAYPGDETARNISDEYLFGDDILVCPVTEYRATARRVYLPEGKWLEVATGKYCEGGWHEAHAPLDTLPLFIRAGAILPLVDACGCSDEALSQKPVFTVVPGADGAYEHYSDARDGYGYKKGEYRIAKYF